jgi:hypothetical protein
LYGIFKLSNKKIYHDDIGEGISIKKILDINNEQKIGNKLESNKVFLNKTLFEYFLSILVQNIALFYLVIIEV